MITFLGLLKPGDYGQHFMLFKLSTPLSVERNLKDPDV